MENDDSVASRSVASSRRTFASQRHRRKRWADIATSEAGTPKLGPVPVPEYDSRQGRSQNSADALSWRRHDGGGKESFSVAEDVNNKGWLRVIDHVLGEWRDSLGHHVVVSDGPAWRNNDHVGFQRYTAVLSRPYTSEKTLAIRFDRKEDRWICGNGYLDGKVSTTDVLVWETVDGRVSEWKRIPPCVPVYFDPPPYLISQFTAKDATKNRGPFPANTIVPFFVESSQNCDVDEGRAIWRLQDTWEKLKNFPLDSSITSPSFTSDSGDREVMQIVFYPTGQNLVSGESSDKTDKTSTLSLTRDVADRICASMRLEFFLNGTTIGSQIIHGDRADVTFAQPSDETTEVVISLALQRE